jgi:chorismate synthase
MSLPAAKGFEVGSGFGGTLLTGRDHNDPFYVDQDGRTRTRSNRSGGIQVRPRPLLESGTHVECQLLES